MAKCHNSEDEFKLVSSRRKSKKIGIKSIINGDNNFETDDPTIDKAIALRRILSAKDDIIQSDFYESFSATIREAIDTLGNPEIKEIVSYGLGNIANSMSSRYQLALLLCLKDKFNVKSYVHDPIFYKRECEILESLGFELIKLNEEGKRKIKLNNPTIVFMPHCPKQLTNNLLWTNWGTSLKDCILIANSFTEIIERNPKNVLIDEAECILNISPYVTEICIINTFKYMNIFNDLSIHVFKDTQLKLLAPDFWKNCKEPEYNPEDTEFIVNKIGQLNLD